MRYKYLQKELSDRLVGRLDVVAEWNTSFIRLTTNKGNRLRRMGQHLEAPGMAAIQFGQFVFDTEVFQIKFS